MGVPQLANTPSETLPVLIDRATFALESARTSAEVLEARDFARAAYDAAKSAGRIAKAKTAHDSIVAEVHRAQGHALAIRARAEMRLAEEYDQAQERGEVGRSGARSDLVSQGNEVVPSASDLGLARKEIFEARQMRDAEKQDQGLIKRTIDGMIERGEEPTRAALKREIANKPRPQKVMDPKALWVWGRLKDFEREGVLSRNPDELLNEMTEPMRADVRRLLPLVREFIEEMECKA